MSQLEVRKIPFAFEGVEFIWNPGNPRFAIDMNKVSFFAIGLERYFCRAVREAEPLIGNPGIHDLARDFREQESIHSLSHRQHVKALGERYPALRGTLDRLIRHFDDLYERESLEYHLGYAAGLESVFTPAFRMLIDNREVLFGDGDARVASLFLWHFCEEVEHRSAALDIFNHVVGSYWFRLRRTPSYLRHVIQGLALLEDEFKTRLPEVPGSFYRMDAYRRVPGRERLRSMLGILGSQLPGHHPASQAVPEYFHEWMARYGRGEDMTQVYGVPVQTA